MFGFDENCYFVLKNGYIFFAAVMVGKQKRPQATFQFQAWFAKRDINLFQ